MKSNPFKLTVRSLLFHLLYTAVSWLLFSLFMSGIRNQMIIDEMFVTLRWAMFAFSMVTFLIFEFIIAYTYFKNAERKRDFLAFTEGELAEKNASAISRINLKESLFITLSALIVQLPVALFYTAFGYGYAAALGFEKLNVGWIGFYLPWGNAFLGMLVNLLIVFLFSYVARILSHRSWDKNRIRK